MSRRLRPPKPLTPAAMRRELQRRCDDLRDPVRYAILSQIGHMLLWHEVESGCWVMTDIQHATWFKRKHIAKAVMTAIGRKHRYVIVRGMVTGTKRKRPVMAIDASAASAELLAAIRHHNLRARRRRLPEAIAVQHQDTP